MQDYHFYKDIQIPTDKFSVNPSKKARRNFVKLFAPIFGLVAILPLFVLMVGKPNTLSFFTKASPDFELRVWTEPSTLVALKGQVAEVKVMAMFDYEKKLIPTVDVTASGSSELTFVAKDISYKRPFQGKVELGTVKFVPTASGTYEITIPTDLVRVTAFDGELKIITGKTAVIVQ